MIATGEGGVLTGGPLGSTCGVSRAPCVAAPSPSLSALCGALERDGVGVVTGGILVSTGSASCPPFVTPFLNGAPPMGGSCTSEPAIGFGSGNEGLEVGGRGIDLGGGGLISINGDGLSCLIKFSICGVATSYCWPCRRRPRIAVCRLGSSNGGASPAAPGLAQYGFRRTSFWTEICPERSSL